MEQMARDVTMEDSGFLIHRRYLLHDHDSKYSSSFRQVIEAGGVKTLALPPRSPNLNAYAERWVRSVREDRKSTRLNSSHGYISYAVFCLKKKKNTDPAALQPPVY